MLVRLTLLPYLLLMFLVGTNTREKCSAGPFSESRIGVPATSGLPVLGCEQRGKSREFSVAKRGELSQASASSSTNCKGSHRFN